MKENQTLLGNCKVGLPPLFCGRGGSRQKLYCPSYVCWHYSLGLNAIVCISRTGNARPYQLRVLHIAKSSNYFQKKLDNYIIGL